MGSCGSGEHYPIGDGVEATTSEMEKLGNDRKTRNGKFYNRKAQYAKS